MNENAILKMEICGYSDGAWPKMIDAKEVERLTGIDKRIVLEYAQAGVCPHVLVAQKDILFMRTHVVRWLRENVLQCCEGTSLLPVPILVKEARQWDVPEPLAMIADRLVEVPRVSGIYFLVHEKEIVYVGQSQNVASRILGHKDKLYDRAFVLPCPLSELTQIEAAYIGFFKPKYNKSGDGNRFVHNDYKAFENPSEVLGDDFSAQPVGVSA